MTADSAKNNIKSKNTWRRLFRSHNLRRLSLLGFTAFIGVVMIKQFLAKEALTTVSAEAYCPYGGLETLYRYITNVGAFVPHTHLSNVILLVGVLGTALVARSGFCGWVCPLGFIQEMINTLSSFLQKRVSPIRRCVKKVQSHGAFLTKADRYIRLVKYAVLIWTIVGAAIFGVMVFRNYDPWAVIINIAEFSLVPGVAVLLLLLVASAFVERPWCRYACPLGAISGLFGKFSPVYLKRQNSICTGCAICTKKCPMGLSVHNTDTINSVDCIGCLECVEACPKKGALELKIGVPLVGK